MKDAAALLPAATRHGGGLQRAAAAFPDAPRPWLDLSTGINPEPWRGSRACEVELGRLPDPQGLAALEAVAARAFGVTRGERLAATAGAEAAIRLSPILLGARSVDVVGPTYGSYVESWRAAGAGTRRIPWEAAERSDAEVLVIANPNNPDGRRMSRAALAGLARSRSLAGRWLIVDESFVETSPEVSVADLVEPSLVVLRSFGKFYGLAGLRLGFLIAPPAVIDRLRALQGDWPVGADAIVMGAAAYADDDWRDRTAATLAKRAGWLDDLLTQARFEILGGTSLFRLARSPHAGRWFEHLCHAGVLTRPFADAPDQLRFGAPAERDFPRLQAALEALT